MDTSISPNLKTRSLRLPDDAWQQIDAAAAADDRKPLEWLRLQIQRRLLPVDQKRNGKAAK
jgi:hypothetical protein